MWRLVRLALTFALISLLGAQSPAVRFPPGTFQNRAAIDAGGVAAYVGPGDIVSGAAGYWGLRGYNAAFSGNVANICDAATGLVCANATWAGSTLTIPTISGLVCGVGINCVVKTLFDQSGNGIDLTQTTLAKMPALTINAINTRPAMTFDHAAASELPSAGNLDATQPFTVSFVAKRTGNIDYSVVLGVAGGQPIWGFSNTADNVVLFAGNVTTAAATDNVTHAVQMLSNGASSIINVDGSGSTVDAGTGGSSTTIQIGNDLNGRALTGLVGEVIAWSGDKSASFAALKANQFTYWGL